MSDKRPIAVDLDGALIMPAEADPDAEQMVFTPRLYALGKPVYGVFTREELEAAYGDLDELRIAIIESGGFASW